MSSTYRLQNRSLRAKFFSTTHPTRTRVHGARVLRISELERLVIAFGDLHLLLRTNFFYYYSKRRWGILSEKRRQMLHWRYFSKTHQVRPYAFARSAHSETSSPFRFDYKRTEKPFVFSLSHSQPGCRVWWMTVVEHFCFNAHTNRQEVRKEAQLNQS